MTEKKKPDEKLEEKTIRVIWDTVDDLPTLYANNLHISHGGEAEFHLFFGELTPPVLFNLSEDEYPETLKIKPVAKIIVTPDVMEQFVKAINENWEKFENKREGKK